VLSALRDDGRTAMSGWQAINASDAKELINAANSLIADAQKAAM